MITRVISSVLPLISIAAYLLIVHQVFMLWYSPTASDLEAIKSFTVLIAFEFVLVHSGVFMSLGSTASASIIFVPLYGIFVWGFNQIMPNNAILYLYCIVIFNRMSFAFSNPTEQKRQANIDASKFAAVIYFLLAAFTVVGFGLVPKLGLNTQFLADVLYYESLASSGLWPENPHLPIAFCAVYFSMLCLRDARSLFGNSFTQPSV